ncbi:cytoplasmic dynein 2 light intermediate chain 1 [Epargyreus clarus]|uniref:cytoplasmic dynein 2 light intermediate chain 1 n=1 Tax=Epargyreus clarus TaxID=520877 RepID=UPI003C2C34A2
MLSIPEIAAQLVNKSLSHPNEDYSRTIFFVGSKSVGKSTLLYSFLDKTDAVRETTVLEYSFGRKSMQKQSLDKIVCHIWEYGGKLEMLKNVLISIPKKGKTFFCIMVDLSKIKNIWNTLETCIQSIAESCKDTPFEIIILGGKYDIFKNYDSEIKKVICTTIRSVALIFGANVIFYSSKDPQQLRKAKEMLHNIGFGNGIPLKDRHINISKPIVIPKNTDTWESVGVPESNTEQVKMRHISRIQPESGFSESNKFVLQRTHPEPILDSLMSLKYQELRNLELFEPSMDEYLSYMQ